MDPTPAHHAHNARLNILLIGALTPRISGSAIPVMQLADFLAGRADVDVATVDVGGIRGSGARGLGRYVRAVWSIFRQARQTDVLGMHINRTALPFIGPAVVVIARLRRARLIIRVFGGVGYERLEGVPGWVARWVVNRADLYLVETKAMVRRAKQDGIRHVAWFANSRPMPPETEGVRVAARCRKFVHVGRLYARKGISELIRATEQLAGDATLDVYGPFWFGDFTEEIFAGLERVRYCGSVSPDEVTGLLCRYDAVILPTHDPTEGYPGVILEAYAAGIPVIATRVGGIPEIVDERSGLLIEPRDHEALLAAMTSLAEDGDLYGRLCQGARVKRAEYAAGEWAARYVTLCRACCRGQESTEAVSGVH